MAISLPKKRIVIVDEIVEEQDLPERFLRRILQKLAKERILLSHKGKSGGFSFLKKPADIKVTDIIGIFQGKIDLTNCFLKGRVCPNSKKDCSFRKRLKEIGKLLDKELEKITVASLLKKG